MHVHDAATARSLQQLVLMMQAEAPAMCCLAITRLHIFRPFIFFSQLPPKGGCASMGDAAVRIAAAAMHALPQLLPVAPARRYCRSLAARAALRCAQKVHGHL